MIDIKQILSQFNTEGLKKKADEAQKKMMNLRVKGESGGGLVSVEMNGLGTVTDIIVDNALFSMEKKAVLCDLLLAAFNVAHKEMEEKTQGMNMANFMNVLPNAFKDIM